MIVPKLKVQILCNDPKGKSGVGTTYGVEFHLNTIGTDYFTYSLLDEIGLTKCYKRYLEVYEIFQREKLEFETYQKSLHDQVANKVKQERLSKDIPEDILKQIKTILPQFQDLIFEYNNGKEKAINSVVGRILKQLKENNFNIDPLLLKETILKLI